MKVGFVALGRMGSAMARRLVEAGHDVAVFNRSAGKTGPLAELGARVEDNLKALCQGRDLVVTMLPSDEALLDVALGSGGLVESLDPAGVHMACGTHGVAAIEAIDSAHGAARQVLVGVPVLGRPELAATGELGLLPAGPQPVIDGLKPVLDALGNKVFRAGDNPASAAAVKLAHNFVLGCAIEAIGEGMALTRKYGAEPALFRDVLTRGLFSCSAYEIYGGIIASEDWDNVGASAAIGLKDADLVIEAGERAGVPLPSVHIWHDRLAAACARGDGGLDWSIMAREQFAASGLK